jgi:prepilin-type processing-associated H-X9-DG protein
MKCSNNLKQMAIACHSCHDANGRFPPQSGTFGGAYYAPILFHLLPYIEQGNAYQSAVWMDYTAGVGRATPNPGTTINTGYVWPTWAAVNKGANTWLRQTKVSVYQCPSDPTLGNGLDWTPGDASYAANFQVFGNQGLLKASNSWSVLMPAYDGATTLVSITDGTSNTIMFAEKLSRCDGRGSPHGTWWMRGVFHGARGSPGSGGDDSFPADRLSAVFGGGRGSDGSVWLTGTASKFQVQPRYPTLTSGAGGQCDFRVASGYHTSGINVGLADGSVRFLSAGTNAKTWWAACTPRNGEVLSSSW